MASGTSSCSNAYMTGTMYADFYGSFSEDSNSIDIANNTSKVNYSAYANYRHSSGLSFGGSTRDEAGYLRVYVNGSLVASATCPMDSGMAPGYRLRTLTGTTGAITHNTDGSKKVSCYVSIAKGSDPLNGGFVWSSASSNTDEVTLTTIARASTPSINTYPTSSNTFTLDDTITIHMNSASSSFRHDVVFYYGNNNNRSRTVATGVQYNCTFNTSDISAQFLADNPNKSPLTGKIKVTTKNGSTTIGSKEITYTANIPNTYSPTASNPTLQETALQSYGVGDNVVVRYLSAKRVTIQATAKNGATISKATATDGTNPINLILSNGIWEGTIRGPSSSNISITVTDSRGKTTSHTFSNLTFIQYSYPTIITATLERTNASTGASSLHVDGTYWNGTAGSVTNKITATYRLNTASSAISLTPTYSGSSWQSNALPGNLNPQNSFSAVISATDAFGQTTSLTIQLPSAHNALWVGKRTVRVHDHLVADGDLAIDGSAGLESIFDILSIGSGGKNLLPKGTYPTAAKSRTASGLTYSTNYDGSISVNGTMTAKWSFNARYFIWDKPTTKAIFTCKSTIGDQFLDGTLRTGSTSTFYAGIQVVDADGSNFGTPKAWNGTDYAPWRIFCGNEELPFLLERHKKYRFFITFENGSSYNWTYFYPMIRDANIISPLYQQYIPRVKTVNYVPSGDITIRGFQIGELVMLFGTTKNGGTVPFGITFDDVPALVIGRSAIGSNSVGSADPNVRLGTVTTSSFYIDTNYGSTTKYTIGWVAVGSYSGPDFWR